MTHLVLVHGFMGGSAQWEPQNAALSEHFELITVDLPGFGLNTTHPGINSIGGFADWVLETVRNIGVEKFHLLGHSMGGMIVQEMTHRAPERIEKLVLYGTGASGALPGRFETIEESKRRALADGPQQTARRIAATWFFDCEDAPAFEACTSIAQKSTAAAISAGLDAMSNWDAQDLLSSIKAETLVLCGDRDRTYSWQQTEQLWRDIPNSSLAVIPRCAHAVHLERPDAFNTLLLDYLAG